MGNSMERKLKQTHMFGILNIITKKEQNKKAWGAGNMLR